MGEVDQAERERLAKKGEREPNDGVVEQAGKSVETGTTYKTKLLAYGYTEAKFAEMTALLAIITSGLGSRQGTWASATGATPSEVAAFQALKDHFLRLSLVAPIVIRERKPSGIEANCFSVDKQVRHSTKKLLKHADRTREFVVTLDEPLKPYFAGQSALAEHDRLRAALFEANSKQETVREASPEKTVEINVAKGRLLELIDDMNRTGRVAYMDNAEIAGRFNKDLLLRARRGSAQGEHRQDEQRPGRAGIGCPPLSSLAFKSWLRIRRSAFRDWPAFPSNGRSRDPSVTQTLMGVGMCDKLFLLFLVAAAQGCGGTGVQWADLAITVLIALIAYGLYQRYCTHRSREKKTIPSLCVTLAVDAFQTGNKDDLPRWAVAINVDVNNNGDDVWCLPVVAVSLRVGPNQPTEAISHHYRGLRTIGKLDQELNLATRTQSIAELGIGETERFTGWCLVGDEDLKGSRFLVARAYVFAIDHSLVGLAPSWCKPVRRWRQRLFHPEYLLGLCKEGPHHRTWVEYVNQWKIVSKSEHDLFGIPFKRVAGGEWKICSPTRDDCFCSDGSLSEELRRSLRSMEADLDKIGMWRCSRLEVVALPEAPPRCDSLACLKGQSATAAVTASADELSRRSVSESEDADGPR